jgi:RNA polymerase sigma-70 factor (ECF subfamily)
MIDDCSRLFVGSKLYEREGLLAYLDFLPTAFLAYGRPLQLDVDYHSAFIRRHGHGPEDTQDLLQEFFACLLEHRSLAKADQGKGRFRSFLLACLRHFLTSEPDRLQAQKRGRGRPPVSLDAALAERRYRLEPADPASPETIFERNWALALLEQVLARVREEQRTWGKEAQFRELQPCLMADPDAPRYAELAARLQTTEEAARMMVHRLRRRYREFLREEIARTADTPAEVEEEIRHLFSVLSARLRIAAA